MFRIVSDYRCHSCAAVTEHWISEEELAALVCPVCGDPEMRKIIGAPHLDHIGMATDGKSSSDVMSTSIDKWCKMREQKARIEKRNLDRHGTVD